MAIVRADSLTAEASYKLMSGVVVPRPIAWITTLSAAGVVNLAPFSCYTFLSPRPPLVGVNVGRRAGHLKDTSRNIHATGEFVVNVGNRAMLDAIHLSADEHEAEVSEVQLLGLVTAPSETVRVPRLADVPVSLECRLHSVQEFGELRAEFIVGEVTVFHFRDGVCAEGRIDSRALDPVCRLAGVNYATLGEIIAKPPVRRTPHPDRDPRGRAP